MTRIAYNCHFLENGSEVKLISVGMIRESDGAELFLVNMDTPIREVEDHPWLPKVVLPDLPMINGELDPSDPRVQPPKEIADRVALFIARTPDPQLWAWFSDYAHVALMFLFGAMRDLPDCVPMRTNDIQQEIERLGSPDVPPPPGPVRNSLSDARYVMETLHLLDGMSATEAREVADMRRRIQEVKGRCEEVGSDVCNMADSVLKILASGHEGSGRA